MIGPIRIKKLNTNTNTNTKNKSDKQQVTMIVRRCLRVGTVSRFHELNKAINVEAGKFKGYLGTRMIEPANPDGEFVTIISFDSYENYCIWEKSEVRKHWLEQIEALVEGSSLSEHFSGLNHWFDPQADGKNWPPDWRMALIAFLAIFPLAYYLPPLMAPWLPDHGFLAAVISIGIVTVLMSYISLPLMVKIFQRWLP